MIEFQVNGRVVRSRAANTTPRLDVLRNELDLKGSRYGCGLEQCGSCLVLVDGAIVEVENAYNKLHLWDAGGRKGDFHEIRLEGDRAHIRAALVRSDGA